MIMNDFPILKVDEGPIEILVQSFDGLSRYGVKAQYSDLIKNGQNWTMQIHLFGFAGEMNGVVPYSDLYNINTVLAQITFKCIKPCTVTVIGGNSISLITRDTSIYTLLQQVSSPYGVALSCFPNYSTGGLISASGYPLSFPITLTFTKT